jgi:drug/metabolite transporter (DMT)-like permease
MLPVTLAFLGAMSYGTADFIGGLYTKRYHVLVVMGVSQTAGLIATGLIVLARDPSIPPMQALAWGLAGGVFGVVGLGFLYEALAVGRMGVVSPIAALSVLVPMFVGFIARADRPSPLQVVGVVLALVGAVLTASTGDGPAPDRRVAAGVWLAVAAAGTLGFFLVAMANSAEAGAGAAWPALLVRVMSVPLIWIALGVRRSSVDLRVAPRDLGVLVGIGVLDNGANILVVAATTLGLLSLVSAVVALIPVATVLLARVLLHERLHRWQAVGVVLAIGGVAMIAGG